MPLKLFKEKVSIVANTSIKKSCLLECGKLRFIGKEVANADEIKANERK